MKALQTRKFPASSWSLASAMVTDFARDVIERLNARLGTDGLEDEAVTPDKLAVVPAASLSRSTAQNIANATDTQIVLDALDYLTGSESDVPVTNTASGSIMVRRRGRYAVTVSMGIETTVDAAGNQTNTTVFRNGFLTGERIIDVRARSASGWTYYTASRTLVLDVADVLTLGVYQVNGGALNTTTNAAARPRLQLEYMGGA